MKNKSIRLIIIVLAQVILATAIYAQGSNAAAQALANNKANYSRRIGNQSRLLNGIKYVDYPDGYTGNAYYLTAEFQNANLRYDGADFYNIPILYDLYREMVVVKYPADTANMSLINDKLDQFSIGNHTFIRIDAGNDQKDIKTGFFELLYNGRSQLVKKYIKDIQEEKSGLTIKNVFNEHTSYYLLKGNIYYPVSGKRQLLNLFKDKKKEIDEYIRSNKIDFSNDEEQGMVKVASCYDRLTK
jgi:hypothetical protein